MSDNNMTLTQKRISNKKIFVYVCLALALALDMAIFSLLAAYSLPVKYWIIPLLLAVFDLGFIAVSLASNFRFGYFRPHLVIYSVAVFALSLAAFLVGRDFGGGSAYTAFALAVYPAVHFIIVVAVVLAIVFSIRNGTRSRALGLAVAAALLAVMTYYTVVLFNNGYFGQPLVQETRLLLFSYDEDTDGYKVVGVEGGSGTRVIVPDEFDGKKVNSVDCAIFKADGVNAVELLCEPDVKYYNENELDSIADGLMIYVLKDNFDTVRNRFYADDRMRAVRRMEPCGLGENEVFVTFSFIDENDGSALFPTWFGQKGDVLSLENAPAWYYHGDISNAQDMYFSYHSNNKKIFDGLYNQGNNINGQAIHGGYRNVEARFDDVYCVSIETDNDGAYESPYAYRCTLVDGTYDPYRYVTLDSADSLISSIPQRSGFSVAFMDYNFADAPIGSLRTYLSGFGNAYTARIVPRWTLSAPVVTPIAGNAEPTYGDTLSLSATASHVSEDISFKYEWFLNDSKFSSAGAAIAISNIDMGESGVYALRVTAYSQGGETTTLESSTVVSCNVRVQKRDLHFEWTLPFDKTYTAADKPVSVAYDEADVINGDSITFTPSYTSVKKAGVYNLYIMLAGACAEKYNALGSVALTIERAPLTVTVADVSKVYDGAPIDKAECSYTAVGLLGADVLTDPSYASAAFTNASAAPYAISVSFPLYASTLSNYNVTYNDGLATINKRTVSVEWSSDDEFIYNGEAQYVRISSVNNVVSGDDVSSMFTYDRESMGVDAGDHEVHATLDSKNYTLGESETVTREFTIVPREITLNWGNNSFTYNGSEQHPMILGANNVAQRDKSTYMSKIVYAGARKNAGADYVASATIDDNNYVIAPDQTRLFTIHRKPVSFVWRGGGSFPYDGTTRTPTVSDVTGAIEADKADILSSITYAGTNGLSVKDFGESTVTATLLNANYIVDASSSRELIRVYKKDITVAWSGSGSFYYDGKAHGATIVSFNGAVAGEEESMLAAITYTGTNGLTVTNVGSTRITADLHNANYSATPLTVEVSVVKREVTLVWSNESFTYNASAQAPSVTSVSNAAEGDAEMILSRISVSAGGVNAGDHTVTASLNPSVANYTIAADSASCAYTIEKKTLTLEWGEVEFGYTGSAIAVAPANADSLPVELTATYYDRAGGTSVLLDGAPIEKGSYSVSYALDPEESVNYALSNFECEFEIGD